jgi:hypothetical protein
LQFARCIADALFQRKPVPSLDNFHDEGLHEARVVETGKWVILGLGIAAEKADVARPVQAVYVTKRITEDPTRGR